MPKVRKERRASKPRGERARRPNRISTPLPINDRGQIRDPRTRTWMQINDYVTRYDEPRVWDSFSDEWVRLGSLIPPEQRHADRVEQAQRFLARASDWIDGDALKSVNAAMLRALQAGAWIEDAALRLAAPGLTVAARERLMSRLDLAVQAVTTENPHRTARIELLRCVRLTARVRAERVTDRWSHIAYFADQRRRIELETNVDAARRVLARVAPDAAERLDAKLYDECASAWLNREGHKAGIRSKWVMLVDLCEQAGLGRVPVKSLANEWRAFERREKSWNLDIPDDPR